MPRKGTPYVPKTDEQRDLYDATHLLALASSNEPSTLVDLCKQLGVIARPKMLRLARSALARSVDAGNWREARAEAEAKLRCGWRPSWQLGVPPDMRVYGFDWAHFSRGERRPRSERRTP